MTRRGSSRWEQNAGVAVRTRDAGDLEVDQVRAIEVARARKADAALPYVYRPGMPTDPRSLAGLQRSAGNAAVQTLLRSRPPRPAVPVQRRASTDTATATAPTSEKSTGYEIGGGGPVDESELIGGSGGGAPKAVAKTGAAEGAAAPSSLKASATGERAAILADAAMSNALIAQQYAAAQGKLAGQIGAAKNVASGALAAATGAATAFFATKRAEVTAAATTLEQAAVAQASAMTSAAQAGAATAHAALTSITGAISAGIQSRVAGVADQIAGAITGISLPDLPGVSTVRAGIAGLVRRAAGAVTAGIGTVQQLVARALRTGLDMVTKVMGMAGSIVMNVIRQVGSAIRAAAAKVTTILTTIAGKVSQALGAFLRNVAFPALDRLKTTAAKHLGEGQKKAALAIKTNTDHHLSVLDKFAKTAAPVGGEQAAGGGGAGEDPSATFRSIGQRARENNSMVVSLFTGRLGSVVASIATMATAAAQQVAARFRGIVTETVATVTSRVQAALQTARQIGTALTSFLGGILSSLKQGFAGAVDWVRGVAAKPVDELVAFGGNMLGAARRFISTAVSNVLRGDFSLPSLGATAFRPGAQANGPAPTEAVTASFSVSAGDVLKVLGIAVAALAGLVLLPALIATAAAAVLVALAALVVVGPLLALVAAILYGGYKLIKWIFTPAPLEVTHDTDLNAPDGSAKSRKVVGVGERVMIKANKLSSFKASTGEPTSTSPKAGFRWRAPFTAGSAEITATMVDKSQTQTVSFTVVEPSSLTAKKEKDQSFPAGEQGVGMTLDFIYGPMNVSFGGVGARERAGPASAIKGYYLREGMPHYHQPKVPDFFPIAENNHLAGATRDSAAQYNQPKPWEHGSFHWSIPNEFQADESAAPKVFTHTTQEFVMLDDTGTTTVTKAGASATRKP